MSLSSKDISALRLLIREEIGDSLAPFHQEFRQFRDEVNNSFDALFKRDEKREEEYLLLREQVSRV